jgi:phosphomannomutase
MVGNGELIASHSGLRGRPGAGLDRGVVEGLVGGLMALLAARGLPASVGVARDRRPSGAELANAAIEAARRRGAQVIDFGVAATPTAKLAARNRGLGAAVVVTGSHLDPEWNGLKLVAAPEYRPLDVRALPPAGGEPSGRRGAIKRDHDAAREHAAAVCASVDGEAVRSAGLRVSLRGGCGDAAGLALQELGCSVVDQGADLGVVMDEDADRLRLIDERTQPLDPETTLPLVATSLEAERLVKGADTSRIVDLLAERRGWSVRVTPPGELHLLEALADWGADVAGEGNGGVVVPEVAMARDALAGAAQVIALLATRRIPLSALAAELPPLARRRANVPCGGGADAAALLATAAERLDAELESAQEGMALERPGGAWALIRQSATEPVLRITVESPDPRLTEEIYAELRAALPTPAGT